jgi:hypothetical protein
MVVEEMTMSVPDTIPCEEAERRIEWILDHPHVSAWLKESVRSAIKRDPVEALNDAELLLQLIRTRTVAIVQETLDPARRAARSIH